MQSIWFSVFELVGAPRFELGTPQPDARVVPISSRFDNFEALLADPARRFVKSLFRVVGLQLPCGLTECLYLLGFWFFVDSPVRLLYNYKRKPTPPSLWKGGGRRPDTRGWVLGEV
jgi:hypothetical protein